MCFIPTNIIYFTGLFILHKITTKTLAVSLQDIYLYVLIPSIFKETRDGKNSLLWHQILCLSVPVC